MLLVPNSIPEGCYDFPTRNISILLFGFSAIHVKFFLDMWRSTTPEGIETGHPTLQSTSRNRGY